MRKKQATHLTVVLICATLILVLISSIGANILQTDGGNVEILDVSIPIADGEVVSAYIFKPTTTTSANPAPCVLPDGRIYLYYRSNTPIGLRIGLAAADKPEGPYRRLSPEPVLEGFNVEDPFAWHDGKEFHIWAKDMEGTITGELHAGAHFVSADGIRWTYREKAYSRSIRNRNGEMIHLGCLERPQLLFDENGEPEYLFAAAADGPGGFRNAFNTWNIAVALNE